MKRPLFATMIRPGSATLTISAVLGLAICASACGGADSASVSANPTGPTPTPSATFTLSGAVSEMTANGPAPIEGARVAEITSGRTALTDANGIYTIPGLAAMGRSVSIAKQGYVTQTKAVTMSGDTLLDFRLDRMVAYTLSGMVFETTAAGQTPVEGVEIYCDSCGSPDGHTFVYTDANGFYSLSWTMNGSHSLLIRKTGFEVVGPMGGSRGTINATVRGDTRLDIELVRR